MRDFAVALPWLNLMETGVAKDASGKTEYSYAHPMFWAPFSLVGN